MCECNQDTTQMCQRDKYFAYLVLDSNNAVLCQISPNTYYSKLLCNERDQTILPSDPRVTIRGLATTRGAHDQHTGGCLESKCFSHFYSILLLLTGVDRDRSKVCRSIKINYGGLNQTELNHLDLIECELICEILDTM